MSAYENGPVNLTHPEVQEAIRSGSGLYIEDPRTPMDRANDRTGGVGASFLAQGIAEGRYDPPNQEGCEIGPHGHGSGSCCDTCARFPESRRGILTRIERIMISDKPWAEVLEAIAFELGQPGPREIAKLKGKTNSQRP